MKVAELNPATLKKHPLPPIGAGDKNAHGSILVIAGSRDVGGAALLCALSAMRAGAGRLQIATVDVIAPHLAMAMPEAMVVGMATGRDGGFAPSTVKPLAEMADKADAVVAGPGLQGGKVAEQLAGALIENGNLLALDAALLHALPARKTDAKRAQTRLVLLPHSGEMASLLGCRPEEVEADPLAAGRACAEAYHAVTLVKGVESHVVTPEGSAFRYRGGGPGLGISGSGDTLAGIVGGLLARGCDPLTALLWGVWSHGEAGRRLSEKVGTLGYLARQIPDEVPSLLEEH